MTLRELWLPVRQRMRAHGEGLGQALVEAQPRRGRRRFGAYIVHAGVVVIVAIAVSSTMGEPREVQLRAGETRRSAATRSRSSASTQVSEPHRQALVARVAVERGGREPGRAEPAHEPLPSAARARRHARGAQHPGSRTCTSR